MADEFGTRDVLEQVGTRLANLEQDQRGPPQRGPRGIHRAARSLPGRVERIQVRLRWIIGLFFGAWLSIIGSIWLKP